MYAQTLPPTTRSLPKKKSPTPRKKRPLLSPLPDKDCFIPDVDIITSQGRIYGALFSEPISGGTLSLVPTPIQPQTSWKLWIYGLFAILGLFAVTLGLTSTAHAETGDGAIDFSVSSSAMDESASTTPPGTDLPSDSPSELPSETPPSAAEPAPESSNAPEIAAANPEPPPPDSEVSEPQAPDTTDQSSSIPSPPPIDSMPPTEPAAPVPVESAPPPAAESPGVLNFPPAEAPTPQTVTPSAPVTPAAPANPSTIPPQSVASLGEIFNGGSNSLVARTVGHAEGTRNPDGSKTRAYQGHSDPGNGVWNLGSFSFQHCREYNCSTAEEADVHQLKRLKGQAEKLQQRTGALGVTMTLLEELNGIDLANQAPAAALGQPGYPEWLKKARDMGLTDKDAVLWARVKSYWDPALNGWNAPGLGNSESRIEHDQNRRLTAIARALDIYKQQVAAGKIPGASKPDQVASVPKEEQMADNIIFQDLSN